MTRQDGRRSIGRVAAGGVALALGVAMAVVPGAPGAGRPAAPALQPAVSDYAQVATGETPPTQAQCQSAGRRCFTPQAIQSAYNVGPLHDAGVDGRGQTIAIVDSYGSDTIAHDLHVFDQAFGLHPMCGEEGVACAPGMPSFSQLAVQGSPATKAPPASSQGTGQEDKTGWALEVSVDVESAHAMAPMANILLVTTPTAETLGVQGFPQMMKAEKYVIDHHLATVISQSFGAAEESFGSAQSLENLRDAFKAAPSAGVTVLASSGDFGTANPKKEPVRNPATIPYPTVGWPASDPLVTGVGGTYLCTDPTATADQPRTTVSALLPTTCQRNPGQAEVGWIDSGGGFSHVFPKPAYQDSLPAGSTSIDTGRGVPDVALQASARTGILVYVSLPPDGLGGTNCGSSPCSTGWYDVGGTSISAPQWSALVALADQLSGKGLGLINPALYKIGADPARYANDFYDVTTGTNRADPSVPGYAASSGWDPVTGLGTPNAAHLVPDLVALAGGH